MMVTGIVLALQASYTLTGAVPMYLVGTLVGKSMILELGPVLTGLSLAGRVGASTMPVNTAMKTAIGAHGSTADTLVRWLKSHGGWHAYCEEVRRVPRWRNTWKNKWGFRGN